MSSDCGCERASVRVSRMHSKMSDSLRLGEADVMCEYDGDEPFQQWGRGKRLVGVPRLAGRVTIEDALVVE